MDLGEAGAASTCSRRSGGTSGASSAKVKTRTVAWQRNPLRDWVPAREQMYLKEDRMGIKPSLVSVTDQQSPAVSRGHF